jgi:hypothetical protein
MHDSRPLPPVNALKKQQTEAFAKPGDNPEPD